MKFNNVRLLVKDYAGCFRFYTEQLGLEVLWGEETGCYASFSVADGIEGLAIFSSDLMAQAIGNADKPLPENCREKSLISFETPDVDDTYMTLSAKGVKFLNTPTDMSQWGMRTVYLRDPEDNLIEIFTPLATEQTGDTN